MATFHFEFNGESYNAMATIINSNGKISCNISRILDDGTDQQAKFIGFELGPVVQNDLLLMKAIYKGLNAYLNNYPVDHQYERL